MDYKSLATALFKHHQDDIKLTKNEEGFYIQGVLMKTPDKLVNFIPTSILDSRKVTLEELFQIHKALLRHCIQELSEDPIPPELEGITLGKDRDTGNIRIFDANRLTSINFHGWKMVYPKAAKVLLASAFEFVESYNPHKPPKWVDNVNQPGHIAEKLVHYNKYFIPTWQRHPAPQTLNELFVKGYLEPFFNHLFPDEESRRYVIWWLFKLMEKRCQDLLILVGERGTGKSTFQALLRSLVGRENFKLASKKMLSKEFNSEFDACRLIAMEDYKIHPSQYEVLKRYMDNHIAVEGKGADPKQIINYASVLLTNNSPNNVYCLADERRYSCPVPTSVPLKELWDADKIAKFNELIEENTEFQVCFAHWIKHEVETKNISFPVNDPFRSSVFWRLVDASKDVAWKCVLNMVRTGKDSINVSDITFRGSHQRKISNHEMSEWIEQEAIERKIRGREPYVILKEVIEDGEVNYENLTNQEEEEKAVQEDLQV